MQYVFRAYFLSEENQSRVFKIPIDEALSRDNIPPPEKGRFVAFAEGQGREFGKFVMAFCEYPTGSKQSRNVHMLAYRQSEHHKASKHLVLWIEHGIASIADNE